ncbi:hypothetical protein GMST_09780 [Geomonas silvestris]|uniref:Uncharacterized protein n=1 Tax=Geomonas silvestris TaxID=2740184 RepID=A0A6V8MFR6_9BACT|nr:PAS domain S-box protein [Geomonas silvestris]GFO58653.1 hypothetical protein GMST_09780 [Geomonas silvestris]
MSLTLRKASHYPITVALVAFSYAAYRYLSWLADSELPTFITFYPMVTLVAVLFGLGPGLLATGLSVAITAYSIYLPVDSFAVSSLREVLSLGLFSVIGLCLSVLAESRRRFEARLVKQQGELASLVESRTAELTRKNAELEDEVARHCSTERELVRLNEHLEQRVRERTAELAEHVARLKEEAEERRAAELALQLSEERYRTVVTDQTELIARACPDGRITFVNEVYCRFFGKSEAELVGTQWRPQVLPEDLREIEERLRLLSADNPAVVVENRVRNGRGELHWLQAVNRGTFDAQGNLVEVQVVARDVCDRKKAEESLRKSEEQFRQMAETVEEVFWLTSPRGELLYLSPAFERIWRRSTAEIFQDPLLCLTATHPDDVPQLTRYHDRLRAGEAATIKYRILRPDGSVRWISDRGYPRKDGKGEVQYIAGVAFDSTAQKESEDRLKHYARRLSTLEEELRKEIAGELHDDVGQELTVLSLNLGHISKHLAGSGAGELQKTVDESRRLVRTIHSTVRDLMVNLRPVQLDEYGLVPVLSSYTELYQRRTGIAVSFQATPEFPRLGAVPEISLFRIAQEALHNVLKHADASRVAVVLEHWGSTARLTITDDGKGFVLPKAPPEGAGSGWGLAIMRERAELIGGSFRIESQPGTTSLCVELGGG